MRGRDDFISPGIGAFGFLGAIVLTIALEVQEAILPYGFSK